MSSLDQLTVNATARWIPENPTIIQRGEAVGGISSQLTFSDWFAFNLSSQGDNDRLNSKSDLSLQVNNREDVMAPLLEASVTRSLRSLVSVEPAPLSLMCPFSVPNIRVISGCNPSYRLAVTIPGTSLSTLQDDLVFSNGASMIQSLPTNYRPPSTLGVAVPNSTYIYNADPSAPRYNDFFSISQSTGIFQQCLGESSRAGCACTDNQKRSMSVADSDCIEKVLRAYQQSTFALKLQLTRDMITYTTVAANYTVTELNHRTDWCILNLSGACTPPDWSYSALADPSQNASIQFKGGELYHFRASVPIGTYCTLRADFPVYVINSTPLPSVHQSAMAISAIVFCFWLLTIYLWYSYKQA
ncbi:cation channel sperm-associated protein subunit beta protein family-domain-containing protein [Catenaria anguillulae PL171]|uniref:Cation channel sperm-associated protein subunit beta protein family-domain-containing protein n=1 Tax=Catenaria anguillulae PL171 TaxID=765915 RepID=A0A1Y2HH78_9FUNG|nr:cation channel sperm-associated protein subunit beta protein family-domain-containing protein [Catenaria anguillulae PL171]